MNIRFYDGDTRRDIQGNWWADSARNVVMRDDQVQWKHSNQEIDCAHVNGVAVEDDELRFVTVLADTIDPMGWRRNTANSGKIFRADRTVVMEGLAMPHSPRVWNGDLLFCEAGRGTLNSRDRGVIAELPGFTRGLYIEGDAAYVGCSAMRYDDDFTRDLPLRHRVSNPQCGVAEVDLETGEFKFFPIEGKDEILDLTKRH